jgi:hypothetical protein
MTTRRQAELVRYVSPFGSPAWMTRERAEQYRQEDDDRYLRFDDAGMLSAEQRLVGPPRIQTAEQRQRQLDAQTPRH